MNAGQCIEHSATFNHGGVQAQTKAYLVREHFQVSTQEANLMERGCGLVVLLRHSTREMELATVTSDVVQTHEVQSLDGGEGAASGDDPSEKRTPLLGATPLALAKKMVA